MVSSDGSAPRSEREQESIKKIDEMFNRGLRTGKRLEIVVSESDIHHDDVAGGYFATSYRNPALDSSDSKDNIMLAGYISDVKNDSFRLVFAWNESRNRPLFGGANAGIHVYGDAVKSYTFQKK